MTVDWTRRKTLIEQPRDRNPIPPALKRAYSPQPFRRCRRMSCIQSTKRSVPLLRIESRLLRQIGFVATPVDVAIEGLQVPPAAASYYWAARRAAAVILKAFSFSYSNW